MEREGLASTDSEMDLVAAAKQARRTANTAIPSSRPPPRTHRTASAAGVGGGGRAGAPESEADDSDSEPFDLIAAAKKRSGAHAAASGAAAGGGKGLASASGQATPAPGAKPAPAPIKSVQPAEARASSDSELDLLALAKQSSSRRPPSSTLTAAIAGTGYSASAASVSGVGTGAGSAPEESPSHSRPPSSARSVKPAARPLTGAASPIKADQEMLPPAYIARPASAAGGRSMLPRYSAASGALLQPAAELAAQPPSDPDHGTHFSVQHAPTAAAAAAAVSRGPSLHELAASELPLLADERPAVAMRTAGAGRAQAAAQPAPASPGVPLASLADLGGVVSAAVGDLASSLRSDICRLEAGWQDRWAEQASSAADLRQRLDGLQASSTSQAREVAGQLQGMAAELALHRSRLETVERAQQAQQAQLAQQAAAAASASPSKSPRDSLAAGASSLAPVTSVIANPAFESSPSREPSSASDPGRAAAAPAAVPPDHDAPPVAAEQSPSLSGTTVEAIMRRLSLLESRVGAQLHQIEEAVATGSGGGGSPRSAPVSPLKSGPWGSPPPDHCQHHHQHHQQQQQARPASRHAESRAAQAAAVAAAAVYGSASQSTECSSDSGDAKWGAGCTHWHPCYEAALPGSPRIQASGMVRPASAHAGQRSAPAAGVGSRRSPGSGEGGGSSASRRSQSRAVELQVAETHAIIAGIQSQIAAIKSSLAHANGELDARRLEAGHTAQRLEQLERTDRHMVKVEAANLAGSCALERRVRSLEDQVAAAARQAAAGGLVARETAAALAALEWRVDKSADATIATIKGLEARQVKQRSDLHSVAATATLAEAKTATLASEVARLQRRIHGSSSPLGCGGSKVAFRLY